MTDNYDDIINMTYKKSDRRVHMSIYDRAAQFAPFSALTGYSDIVGETERLTSRKIQLDEYEVEHINRELRYAMEHIEEYPEAVMTYFVPDEKKSGGEYRTLKDKIKKIDDYEGKILFTSGVVIPFEEIIVLSVERTKATK